MRRVSGRAALLKSRTAHLTRLYLIPHQYRPQDVRPHSPGTFILHRTNTRFCAGALLRRIKNGIIRKMCKKYVARLSPAQYKRQYYFSHQHRIVINGANTGTRIRRCSALHQHSGCAQLRNSRNTPHTIIPHRIRTPPKCAAGPPATLTPPGVISYRIITTIQPRYRYPGYDTARPSPHQHPGKVRNRRHTYTAQHYPPPASTPR